VGLGSGSNLQNTSAFYLENIYRILSDSGSSRAPFSATVTSSLLFSPPKYVVWVNSLWVLSLVISLTCAGLATLVQQWARRYVKFIERPRYNPHQRMRVRTFFSYGVVKFHVSWVIEALLLLIHISLFLFFAGILVFLHAITHPLFGAVVWWMALLTIIYMCITLLPICIPNSPYYTPLSSIVWVLYTGISFLVYEVLSSPLFGTRRHFRTWRDHYYNRLVEGMGKTAEKTASQRSLEIDIRFMMSTLDAVVGDDALVEFFESIPGFFDSDRVNDLEERLLDEFRVKLSPTLDSFLDHTFSSDSETESVKSSRLVVCLNATHAVLGPDRVSQILFDILNGRWQGLKSIEVADSLRQWSKDTGDEFIHYVQRIVTQVVVDVRECDDRWISLVVNEFGVPEDVLRDKMGHGNSMMLCLLLYMIRQADESGSWVPWILSSLCQFDVCNTLPELQHEFCTLWNNIVGDAWARRGGSAINILREIRNAYIQLHQGTGAAPTTFSARTNYFNPVLAQPQSYRFCNITGHRTHVTVTPQGPVTVPQTTAGHILPLLLSTAQRGDPPNPIPQFPSSAGFPPRSSTHGLTHRHTYPSLSSSPPPIRIAQRASSVKAAPVPEIIRSTAVRGHTLDRRHSLVPTAVSRHAPRRATLSASDSAANIVRLHEPTPHTYHSEREETIHSPVTASLSTLPRADTPTFTDSPSSIGPGVPSFSESGPIYSSPRHTDQTPPVYTPDARPPVRLTTRSSLTFGSNGRPAILEEDIAAPSSAPCSSEIPPTAKPIPQSILPTGGGATPQRNEEAATAVRLVPSMTVSDSQSASSALLPPLYGDMIPGEPQSLRSTFPSPTTAVSHNPRPSNSILAVHVTASIETLSTSDGTRDHCPPILTRMKSKSSVPDAEIYQHDINKS
jgi:Family of unknown function (DUF6535)